MSTTTHTFSRRGAAVLLSALLGLTAAMSAQARAVPGDGALPVVELMPLTMRYETELALTPEQIRSLEAYRKQAMPGRVALQQRIIALRGELRIAILDNRPQTERDALMQQIGAAEIEHFKGRERCVEHVRSLLNAEQFAELKRLYLAALR